MVPPHRLRRRSGVGPLLGSPHRNGWIVERVSVVAIFIVLAKKRRVKGSNDSLDIDQVRYAVLDDYGTEDAGMM